MMPATPFVHAHAAPVVKGAVHGAVLTLTCACLAYNVSAYRARPAPHLAVNIAVYTALGLFEVFQVWHHATARGYAPAIPERRWQPA